MLYKLDADMLVLMHFSFIVFAVLGGLLVLRWPAVAWIHIPTAGWGAWIEITHGVCPLTTFEKSLRTSANAASYPGSFIDNYIIPIIYPPGLTPEISRLLGFTLLIFTVLIYAWVVFRYLRNRAQEPSF